MLREAGAESHLIISAAGKVTISQETDWKVSDVVGLATVHYDPHDIAAAIASGSFAVQGMIVIPCSIKTLSGIANSYAEDLIVRAADVTLKEGRPLVLVVRETPLHRGHLRLMDLAARAGAILFPPVPAFYGRPQSLDEVISATVGRALLRLGIDNPAYTRWQGL
jgi:4-hydroxy-3-polyprenylbenzoate decarboxylase